MFRGLFQNKLPERETEKMVERKLSIYEHFQELKNMHSLQHTKNSKDLAKQIF